MKQTVISEIELITDEMTTHIECAITWIFYYQSKQ
jgi:hypothetical protein